MLAATLAVAVGLSGACVDQVVGVVHWEYECGGSQDEQLFTETQVRELDLLFVIDNSGSMADEQQLLRDNFPALIQALRGEDGVMPDVHIGVVTTDIGVLPHSYPGCSDGGDRGIMHRGGCGVPTSYNYLVNTSPRGCGIARDEATGVCLDHACGPEHCEHELGSQLETDGLYCPRCVNHGFISLESAFSCIANVGDEGCGFEQPLEAMRKALDGSGGNPHFLRPYSFLAVIFITDEDDCSADDTIIYDNATEVSDTHGPFTSFRCFEFGVTCDEATAMRDLGWHQDCRASGPGDASALMVPVDEYVDFLRSLRASDQLAVAAIAGPQQDNRALVALDDYNWPTVMPSCGAPGPLGGGAAPGFRLKELVEAFNPPDDMDWAYTSICEADYTAALTGMGAAIRKVLDTRCLALPLDGCYDPGALYGEPLDDETCNDGCDANCQVYDVHDRGTDLETKVAIPDCLHVCPGGPCPENESPSGAYAGGQPAQQDPDLPVPACFWIAYNPACTMSNGAEMVVARREEAPVRAFLEVRCLQLPDEETCCFDGIDNDQDCLYDFADPDCADAHPDGSGTDRPL